MRRSFGKLKLIPAGFLAALAVQPAVAAAAPPVFSPNAETAWVGIGIGALLPVPGSPSPVVQDPAYPYIPNGTPGKQPTQRVGDLSNPNLKQWVKDIMKKDNDEVIAGKFAFTSRSSCIAAGVPGFDVILGGALFILQQPKKITMIFDSNSEVRHIYLDVPHSAKPKSSWYGESVGHFEDDTLVVDTIGLNAKTFLDNYRTPHSDKLHVVERWRMIENGAKLEIRMTIEDPEAYNAPFQVLRQYDRVTRTLAEDRCSENNSVLFDYGTPVAEKADF